MEEEPIDEGILERDVCPLTSDSRGRERERERQGGGSSSKNL